MKAVMISIQPKWVEKIVSGEKTIEVRKTVPKLEPPFKCYIYCTQGHYSDLWYISQDLYNKRMKVIGEFICDRIDEYTLAYGFSEKENKDGRYGNIKDYCYFQHNLLLDKMCLTEEEFNNYGKGEPLYGLHISNLKIYDKPKEISEFKVACTPKLCLSGCESVHLDNFFRCINQGNRRLTRPPQSWCYIEE